MDLGVCLLSLNSLQGRAQSWAEVCGLCSSVLAATAASGQVGNSCEVLVILTDCFLAVFPAACSCQFVVSEDQDYAAHFADPDTLVNWDFVEQVVSGFTKFLKSLEGGS